jgi:zinc transport system substrate-binding protein
MHFNHTFRYYAGVFVLLLLAALPLQAKTLKIVTSIRPLHSLVAGVTDGVSTPSLLIEQLQSPHDYHLRPSDIDRLQQADMIIYAGPQVETFMGKILARLAEKKIIAVSQIAGMTLLPGRALPHHDETRHGHDDSHRLDGHVWLSTDNARRFVDDLLGILLQLDPGNAEHYRRNVQALQTRLDNLQGDIAARLSGIRDEPFIQFHDAFQYFEKQFGLNGGLFFTTGAEHKIGIRQLHNIRQQIVDKHIRCIYYEPPVIPPILNNLRIPGQTQLLPLEPLGIDLSPGADLYFQLMDNIAQQLEVCLKPESVDSVGAQRARY